MAAAQLDSLNAQHLKLMKRVKVCRRRRALANPQAEARSRCGRPSPGSYPRGSRSRRPLVYPPRPPSRPHSPTPTAGAGGGSRGAHARSGQGQRRGGPASRRPRGPGPAPRGRRGGGRGRCRVRPGGLPRQPPRAGAGRRKGQPGGWSRGVARARAGSCCWGSSPHLMVLVLVLVLVLLVVVVEGAPRARCTGGRRAGWGPPSAEPHLLHLLRVCPPGCLPMCSTASPLAVATSHACLAPSQSLGSGARRSPGCPQRPCTSSDGIAQRRARLPPRAERLSRHRARGPQGERGGASCQPREQPRPFVLPSPRCPPPRCPRHAAPATLPPPRCPRCRRRSSRRARLQGAEATPTAARRTPRHPRHRAPPPPASRSSSSACARCSRQRPSR